MVAECWHALGAAHVPPQALIHPEGKEKRSAALFAAAPHVLLGSLSNEKTGLQVQLLLHVFCMHE